LGFTKIPVVLNILKPSQANISCFQGVSIFFGDDIDVGVTTRDPCTIFAAFAKELLQERPPSVPDFLEISPVADLLMFAKLNARIYPPFKLRQMSV
jgi:hypothetical protein